ncbi:MAG TPA: mononuclear molybdenum enzyme YedY, partial [Pseudomonadales bacterium]|nr:mononuclear molybdenum enzyme YedY [Pseudomonadales bacterium]
MLIKKRPDLAEHQVTDETLYHARRDFLARCGHLTCLSLFGGLLGCGDEASSATQTPQWLSDQLAQAQPPQPAFTTDETRTPFEDVTRYNNFYEFGSDKGDPARHSDRFKPHPWSVVVEGACQKPGRYALEDLVKPHRLEERIYRLRCVEAWSMVVPWVGL